MKACEICDRPTEQVVEIRLDGTSKGTKRTLCPHCVDNWITIAGWFPVETTVWVSEGIQPARKLRKDVWSQ